MSQPPMTWLLLLLARNVSRTPRPSRTPSLKNLSSRKTAHVKFRVVSIFGGKRYRAQSARAAIDVVVIRVAWTEPPGMLKFRSSAAKNASRAVRLNSGSGETPRALTVGVAVVAVVEVVGNCNWTTAVAAVVVQPRRAPRVSRKGREHATDRCS
jgi:hypothetical protein